jgi:hypothetical protein
MKIEWSTKMCGKGEKEGQGQRQRQEEKGRERNKGNVGRVIRREGGGGLADVGPGSNL